VDNSSEFRKNIFNQIHQICFHGQGGYDWNTVYNMPIWLRKFTFSEIKNYHEEQAESIKNSTKNSNTKSLVNEDGTVNTPNFTNASEPYKGKTSYK
jgi:hypothetical protein